MKTVTVEIPLRYQELLDDPGWYEVFQTNIQAQANDVLQMIDAQRKRNANAVPAAIRALGGRGRSSRILWQATRGVTREEFDELWEEQAQLRALARRGDPETAHEAARRFSRGSLCCWEVYLVILDRGLVTADDVALILGRPSKSVSPRITPLKTLGLIADSRYAETADREYIFREELEDGDEYEDSKLTA